jgi:formate dehydrogenase subunit gamma
VSASQAVSSRPARQDGQILRYSLSERVNHWIAGLFYIYCLTTGLAFWSPYMFWLADLVGGGPAARFWHPWFGLVFAASVFWMFKIWHSDMSTTEADLAWKETLPHYVHNEDEETPAAGRFNYGQKLFFWLVLYGAILLVISGFGLWFVESIPEWLRLLCITVHVVAALATIGATIIHVYMGVFVEPESLRAMIHGDVSRAWARAYHRIWYEQITRGASGKK